MTDEELIESLLESLKIVKTTIQKLYARISQDKRRGHQHIGDKELLEESIQLRGQIKEEIDNARLRIAIEKGDNARIFYYRRRKDYQYTGVNQR